MTDIGIAFTLINALVLFGLPRRLAPVPLLVGACYMTLGQGIELGPFSFTVIRLLIAVGIVRVIIRSEYLEGKMNGLDWLMLTWSAWALVSSIFHADPLAALIFRAGRVYNACGIYFLLRGFCRSLDDVVLLCRISVIVLIPVAAEMLSEHLTRHNMFSMFGGVSENPSIRQGRIRAQGPFAHSILAGTIGAVSLPLAIGLWNRHRKTAVGGFVACAVMVIASASSGPVVSAIAALVALWMWRYHHMMTLVRWVSVFGYIGLDVVMKAPAYFLIARIDLAGGSTGWYRARLIQSAFQHLHEWWLAGTDYTRHWMPNAVRWSENHTDITNYYLKLGVLGGLPLLAIFIAILLRGFSSVGQTLRKDANLPPTSRFIVWALGASLFAHAVTFIAVSYFDQSFVFIYLTLALIGSTESAVSSVKETDNIPKYEFTRRPESAPI